MNTGMDLATLGQQVQLRYARQTDFLAKTANLEAQVLFGQPALHVNDDTTLSINPWAHNQLAEWTGMGARYYRRLIAEAPDLWATNLNHWFQASGMTRMLRAQDTRLRAFLSDVYKRVDNPPVLAQAITAIRKAEAEPTYLSNWVSDDAMQLKVLFPGLSVEVKDGRTVHPGVHITNSEVGGGYFKSETFFFDSFCTNGCIFGKDIIGEGIKMRHAGPRLTDDTFHYQKDTIEAEIAAVSLQVRDQINAITSEDGLDRLTTVLRSATVTPEIDDPEKGVKILARSFGLTEEERSELLVNLIEDKDKTKWGAASAITKIANTTKDYGRATFLEYAGGKLLQATDNEWSKVALAA